MHGQGNDTESGQELKMALPLLAIGTGLQAGSSILSGFLGSREKKAEKALAKYNAALMDKQAKEIEERTRFQLVRQAEAGEREIGFLRTTLGASGMVAGAGGVGDELLAEQRSELELESLLIGYEGRLEASQARSGAGAYRMQAKMLGQQARNTLLGGFLGAGSAIGQGLMMYEPKNPDWFKKVSKKAATGAGSYGGTGGGGPTGGASRSMIG